MRQGYWRRTRVPRFAANAARTNAQNLQQQDSAVQSAQRYVKLATTRNLSGLDPYLNVLTAQLNLPTYQRTCITFPDVNSCSPAYS